MRGVVRRQRAGPRRRVRSPGCRALRERHGRLVEVLNSGHLIVGFVGLLLGAGCGQGVRRFLARQASRQARSEAQEILASAELRAATIGKEAEIRVKEEALRRREEIEREIEADRRDLRDQERRLEKRSDLLDEKLALINRKEQEAEALRARLQEQQAEVDKVRARSEATLAEQLAALHRLAGLDPEQARAALFARLEDQLRR
ncbi:hypothetical protein BH23PLA1_BH23PLA1_14830 [soil metagenome]